MFPGQLSISKCFFAQKITAIRNTYNWRIWALNIYATCLSDRADWAVALLTETRLTVGDAVVLFLVLCCYLGGNGGIKSAQGELRERRGAEESSGDRGRPHSSSQHALSPFGFQKPMRNPLIWHLDSHQKGFSPSINCSQESECHKH